MKYNVSAIPTIIIFKNGQQVKRFTGAARQEDLAAAVDAAMAH
jgi:thioredoxin-like negative regulator of GroEL